ncbi:acyl-CoA dehydrogenase family protein [Pseudonocardia sp. WMMC193]|uniref:acyl-CoA dehydrogenase family protein n=1 Tax=Pseudonocardia sp. WMMC193 TaxID=2911965 RepID=UPI001F3E7127|nr:acyl-CoA dehydrogenase family protein [Pseudonocardia sp. WMMC193]MCF7553476.1 acyl-CoA dehydrogenase family protein [Pseudonocardia sp. WMMC193]
MSFAEQCRAWLAAEAGPRQAEAPSYAIFHDRTDAEERALLQRCREWQARRVDAGFGAITWGPEWGGPGLTAAHEREYAAIEAEYAVPERHETLQVTVDLVAPTVHLLGTAAQRERFVRPFLRGDLLCCQLFSEPGAGSDLASLSTRAVRTEDGWRIDGQKVWTSGAQFAEWGLLIARSDPTVRKHAGMTAFLLPMDTPGVEIRPIRQMSGGSTFNEVFLTDVTVSDEYRLGAVGEGWKVALTTLSFERSSSGGVVSAGGGVDDLVRSARARGRADDPRVRVALGEAAVYERAAALWNRRIAEREQAGAAPGAEGSVGKLVWTQNLTRIGRVAADLLGPRILADTGVPDTWGWAEHLLGAPGYRIAGGSDEIQRTIIGERALGLPREPRSAG